MQTPKPKISLTWLVLVFSSIAFFGFLIFITNNSFGARCKKAGVKPYHFPECVRRMNDGESIIDLDFYGKASNADS